MFFPLVPSHPEVFGFLFSFLHLSFYPLRLNCFAFLSLVFLAYPAFVFLSGYYTPNFVSIKAFAFASQQRTGHFNPA